MDFEGDCVAQGLELIDGTGPCFGWLELGEVVGSGILVELAGHEHVPHSDEDRMFNGNEGSHGSAPCGDSSVLRTEIRLIRSGHGQRDYA